MNSVVCVKRVPFTQEVDFQINEQKMDVKKDTLAYVINEWDNYALEEAVLLKEQLGGQVTAITVGTHKDEEVLRRCLAMGVDKAIRIETEDLPLDALMVSRLLAEVIKTLDYDLIFTGVQADDVNEGAVGMMLAEHLGIARAAVVTGLEIKGMEALVRMELEGGMDEISRITLPALLSIQTGIHVPRYVSMMAMRKAARKELKIIRIEELGFSEKELSPSTSVEGVFLPSETEGAVILEGDPETVAEEILRIIRERGLSL